MKAADAPEVTPHLVINNGHVVVAQLLKGICQVGMRFGHSGVKNNAAIIKGNALLVVPKLVVNGSNQQQQACLILVVRV